MIDRSQSQRIAAAILLAGLICLAFNRVARGWGANGQDYVAALAVVDLPKGPLRDLYQTNLGWIETNASFPDRWAARNDQAASARDFLHPEAFGGSAAFAKIPHDYKSLVKLHSYDDLREIGVLPWTVDRHYKLLVNAWATREWDSILWESAMLSHFVADAHSPFHATTNDDGQLSQPPQTGVRNRFEIDLIERSVGITSLRSGDPLLATNPSDMCFTALAQSAQELPKILDADRAGLAASSGELNGAYWASFIPQAQSVAIARIQTAGQALAGLLLGAWKDAGSPTPPPNFLMSDRYIPFAPAAGVHNAVAQTGMPHVSVDQKDSARERVRTIKVASQLLHRDVEVSLLVPTDYDTSQRRYPVLYLLHGSSGSEKDWPSHSGIAAYTEQLPLIVVMPDGGNSWYVNSPGQGRYEDFFINELIPAIDRTLRTVNSTTARAIAGNSMGGYGAWRLAVDHPALFSAAASLSGALDMGISDPHDGEPIEWCSTLYGSTEPAAVRRYNRDNLHDRMSRLNFRGRWRGPALYFDAGSDDYLLAGDRHMEQFLLEQGIPYEYSEFDPGSHSWSYWDLHIRDVLQFVLRHLAPPTAN